jgi:NADH-quinone oxidoreductase subunit H
MSMLTSLLFLGGWLPFPFLGWLPLSLNLAFKTIFVTYLFIWVRATFPRIRYDQLMQLLWKSYLPLTLSYILLVSSFLIL